MSPFLKFSNIYSWSPSPRFGTDTLVLKWLSFMCICFVTWGHYKDFLSAIAFTGFYTEKLRSEKVSINMLLINIFGSQSWKSSRIEPALSPWSSVSSCTLNSNWAIWVLKIHLTNQIKIESRDKTTPVELFLREWTVTTLTSKVFILRTLQTYLLKLEATSC